PAPAPAAAAGQAVSDPTAAVRAVLEQQGKTSLLTIVDAAAWNWSNEGGKHALRLAFAAGDGRAALAQQASTRKTITAACVTALGYAPEIAVSTEAGGTPAAQAGAAPEAAARPGGATDSPEARAEQHPLLRKLKEQVPMQVLRTRMLPANEGKGKLQ
ncbi:MAG: hypothetical protein ACRD1F_12425, partial [Terriglobales bacterium]